MANEILIHTSGAPICWADSAQYAQWGYSPGNVYARTHNITLRGLANNIGRQSDKADLGVKRAQGYVVKSAIEFATAPTAGAPIEYYWSSSSSSHPASGNAGGYDANKNPVVSGIDGAYNPATDEAGLDEWKQQLQFVGILSPGADTNTLQSKVINSYFTPAEQYGQFVVKNDCAQTLSAAGSGMYIVMIPVMDEIQ